MMEPPCKQNCDEVSLAPPRALYVHVPFCVRKCRYCDFYSRPLDAGAASEYVEAAIRELRAGTPLLAAPLATVYVGGGTPTTLPGRLLRQLLAAIWPLIDERTEFTVEANPGTVREGVAEILVECGVNRVALGAQSLRTEELRTLGRIHTPQEVPAAIVAMRQAGIVNIGLDLIYAVPGQTLGAWRDSLGRILELQPQHLSAYALSFEEGTPLCGDLQAGRVAAMDEGLQRECYDAVIEAAAGAGLEHYEISNFARPGRRCEHNMTYWHNLPYLGIGPAAASYVGGVRRTNTPDLAAYMEAIRAGMPAPCSPEQLPPRMVMAETLMLGLRLIEGIDRGDFSRRFGIDPAAAFPKSFARHLDLGTLQIADSHIRIAREALFVSDAVLADIVEEAHS
jgi:oxygen-independent coproporphyrinogen-3 oxidase